MYVHTDRTDAAFFSIFNRSQQCGRLCSVVDRNAQAFQFVIKCRFERGTPHTQGKTVLIIVRKHQLRLIVAEFRPLEFILCVTDLSAEAFQIQHTVIAFSALDIMCDTVAVVILLIHIGIRDLLRSYLRTRVRTGGFPVVKSCSCRSASLGCPFLYQYYFFPFSCCRDRRKTSCKSST